MKITERIHRCKYCKREMNNTSDQRAGNPFCNECLEERTKRDEDVTFVHIGNGYFRCVPVTKDKAD